MGWLWTLAACIGVCAGTLWACVIHGKLADARRIEACRRRSEEYFRKKKRVDDS